MKASAYVRMHSHVRQDGRAQLYLQVTIDPEKKLFYLDQFWYPALFDGNEQQCQAPPLKRGTKASPERKLVEDEVADINLVCQQARAKASGIFTEARLRQSDISLSEFVKAWNCFHSRTDFIAYFREKLNDRYARREISTQTFRCQRATLHALAECRPVCLFSQLKDLPKEFELYLKNERGNRVTTRWGRHKDVKKYLHLAQDDEISFAYPYRNFKVPKGEGLWRPCTVPEFQRLDAYYRACAPGSTHRRVLQRFLFACMTALRISDQQRIQYSQIWGGDKLVYVPWKKRHLDKPPVIMPLTPEALGYVEDSRRENNLKTIFISERELSEQKSNEVLHAIGQELRIESKLHHHVAREFFATEYLAGGGNLEMLQVYMAHEQITTTMRYVHIDQRRKMDAIAPIRAVFNRRLGIEQPAPPAAAASA